MSFNVPGGGSYGANLEKRRRHAERGGGGGGNNGWWDDVVKPIGLIALIILILWALN